MRTRWHGARPRRRGLHHLLVGTGMSVFVITVYVVIVRGIGALIGRTESPSISLSVVATATVALSFARVQTALDRWALRVDRTHTPEPYDVLNRFSEARPQNEPT